MYLRSLLSPSLCRLATPARSPASPLPRVASPSVLAPCCGTPRTMTTLPRLPILEAVSRHDPASTAVVHAASGRRFTYGELLGDVGRARDRLREARGGADLDGERVAFLVENSYDYVGEWQIVSEF